jgi:hypothetical protein
MLRIRLKSYLNDPDVKCFSRIAYCQHETNIFENIAKFIMLTAWTAKEMMMGGIFDPHTGPAFG